MNLTKSISRTLAAGALACLSLGTARAADTVGQDQSSGLAPELAPELTYEGNRNTQAQVQARDAALAEADHYEQRAELYRSFGGVGYKTGEVQRSEQQAAKYRAEAAQWEAVLGQTSGQCPPQTP